MIRKNTVHEPAQSAGFSRRTLLKTLPALAVAPRLLAQGAAAPIPVLKLHNFGLRVSDVQRSLDFYQGLFGSGVQARQGETLVLRIGDGPYFYSLTPTGPGENPGITHVGLSVRDFNLREVENALAAHGIAPGSAPARVGPNIGVAGQSWHRVRGPDAGGAPGGTHELFFADRDGIYYQLNGQNYCAGSSPLGNTCGPLEASPVEGRIRLRELSHFTNSVHNREDSNRFHRQLFGLDFQAYQGPNGPVIGIGDGFQFLMYVGGSNPGAPVEPGRIDHVCMGMDDFNVDRVLALLTDYGLSARQDPADTQPLMHWISMRMPNRGGAEGGTPELYFSDPDGIRIQLQDPAYCGGTGYLGDDCSA
jgi:catechol 2,3-dioxygenase-like lactoylglutathione lyase family enzyme